VKLAKPDGAFPFGLVGLAGMMISPASLAASSGVGAIKPIGTGPFKVEDFTASDVTTLARFDKYWGGTANRPAHFEVHYVPKAQTRLSAVRSGQANVVLLEPNQVKDAQDAGLQLQVNRGLATWTMYPNLHGPLKDLRVRQALSMAIDRDGIAKGLTFGTGVPTCQPFPPGYAIFVAEVACKYDPAGAKKLLAEAGYPNGLKLDYVLLNTPEYTAMTEAVQANLQAVGITMNITTIDVAQFGRFVSGKVGDFMMGRWGGRADPLTTLQVLTGPGGTYTPGGTVGPEYDALLQAVTKIEAGSPAREAALRSAARYSAEHLANFNIVTRTNLYVFAKGCIQGLTPNLAAGSDDWRDVTIAKGCS
jgi:peptide/nickel transport system substrate-binding protein